MTPQEIETMKLTLDKQSATIQELQKELLSFKQEKDLDEILNERGRATTDFIEKAPEVIKEITQQMIKHRDMRARERFRKQVRAIYDMIFADTLPGQAAPLKRTERASIGDIGGNQFP